MRPFAETQTLQHSLRSSFLQVVNDGSSGEGFELADTFTQVRCLSDEVQMVFENDVAVEIEMFVGLLISPATQ